MPATAHPPASAHSTHSMGAPRNGPLAAQPSSSGAFAAPPPPATLTGGGCRRSCSALLHAASSSLRSWFVAPLIGQPPAPAKRHQRARHVKAPRPASLGGAVTAAHKWLDGCSYACDRFQAICRPVAAHGHRICSRPKSNRACTGLITLNFVTAAALHQRQTASCAPSSAPALGAAWQHCWCVWQASAGHPKHIRRARSATSLPWSAPGVVAARVLPLRGSGLCQRRDSALRASERADGGSAALLCCHRQLPLPARPRLSRCVLPCVCRLSPRLGASQLVVLLTCNSRHPARPQQQAPASLPARQQPRPPAAPQPWRRWPSPSWLTWRT